MPESMFETYEPTLTDRFFNWLTEKLIVLTGGKQWNHNIQPRPLVKVDKNGVQVVKWCVDHDCPVPVTADGLHCAWCGSKSLLPISPTGQPKGVLNPKEKKEGDSSLLGERS
jgi:hypothetical protein